MASRNQGLFEDESDEDSINTTTTAESGGNSTGEYAVEKILAEDQGPDGKPQYLLKWEGYPLAQCTWEKRDNITSELLLRDWAKEKLAVARGEKEAFDIEKFYSAVESWMEEEDKKRDRRTAKRQKRGETVKSRKHMQESEDELTKPVSPKRTKAKAAPVKRKGVAQPVTKGRVRAITLDDEDESPGSSECPLSKVPSSARQKNAKTNAVSKTVKRQTKTAESVERAALSGEKEMPSDVDGKDSGRNQISSKAATVAVLSAPQPSTVTGARKSVSASATNPAARKRSSTSNFSNDDGTKEKQKRQRARVSGETPKDSGDSNFTRLSTQNRYQKYGRNEPAPDPNALRMVDPKTGKTEPPKATPTKTGPSEIHSVYGRRTPPPSSKARPPSPQTTIAQAPPLTRQITDGPTVSSIIESESYPSDVLENAKGIPLKQITCKFWRAGTCQYTAEKCQYAHFYGPTVFHPKKQTTCFYWNNGDNCKFSADQCEFAHFDTGYPAGPPGTFNRRHSMAPAIADVRAADLRLAANSSSPNEVFFDAPEQPPPLLPELAKRRESEPVLNESPARARIVKPIEPVNGSTNEMPITVIPATVTDPRLAGRSFTTDTVTTSPAKDPRLLTTAPETTGARFELPLMEQPGPFTCGSLEVDLNMAKRYISTLDGVRFLKDKNGPVKYVYIHMTRERAGELKLLRKYFQSLHCKVYSPHPGSNQWDFFRRTFEKPSCLLIFHPSEHFVDTIPGLHHYLMEKGAQLRAFSIGVQHQQCIREHREPAYEAQRLFPHGGITFITDDVFVYYPEKATEIIEKFLRDAKEKPPGGQLSKIGARPGVKDWMLRIASKKFEEQGGEGHCTDIRWIQCYEALCRLCPDADEDPDYPDHSVPLETSHLWSVWEESMPSFKGRWESGDEEGATDYMANHFAGEACDKAWKYRKFLFVYHRPGTDIEAVNSQGVQEVKQEVDPKGWMKKYCHIGVVTPDQALKSMRGKK